MYRLKLLGGVSLHGPSGPLWGRIVQGHHLALLALLVRHPDAPLIRDKAAGLLWGDRPESKARARLSDTLYRLRQELGDEAILSVADALHLNEEMVRSDVATFEAALEASRWREAVGLYKGPFLDGFHLDGAVEFERWLDGERRRFSLRHRQALEKLAEAAEAAGEWSEAVAWWKGRLAQEPTNTPVVLRLMKALAACGDIAGAVKQARIHERRLREDLDLPLPQEVRALVDGLTEETRRGSVEASEGVAALEGDGTGRKESEAPGHPADEGGVPPRTSASARELRLPSPPTSAAPGAGSRWRPRPRVPAIGALAVMAVLAVGWAVRVGIGGEGGEGVDAPGGGPPVIVVLPFQNLGPSDDAHFADGITEELIVRLAAVPGLSVIARSSALRYGGASADIREVGRELGADYALEGTVRWEDIPDADGRVRITAQLLRASDGTLLWADSYDRELVEIFDVQSEIADEVASELHVTFLELDDADPAREPTGELEAYDHYLQGRSYLALQFSEDAARAAIGQYERAVELDPEFAAAWRRLIETRLWLTWVFADEEAGLRAAEDLAHLLKLDLDDLEVRLGRAWFLYYGERRYDEALRKFERIRESRPHDPEVIRVIGFLQTRMGRVEMALETLGEALELDPRDAELAFAIGHAHRAMGRYDEAERYYRRAISLAPDMGFAYAWLSVVQLARDDTLQGREARERAWELGADPPLGGGRSDLYEGDLAEAVERLRSRPAGHRISRMFRYDALADAYGRMGREEHRTVYADSLLELASGVAPEDWDRPRGQAANLGWVFSGLALIHLGEPERGLEHVRRGLEMEVPFRDVLVGSFVRTTAARAFVRTGRSEEAIALLEEAQAAPADLSPYDLQHDPEWEPLRDHPRFQSLMEASPRGG